VRRCIHWVPMVILVGTVACGPDDHEHEHEDPSGVAEQDHTQDGAASEEEHEEHELHLEELGLGTCEVWGVHGRQDLARSDSSS